MPATAIDTYAATNPALCAIILRAYIEGFAKSNPNGLPFPLILLPIPIVLNSDIVKMFEKTKGSTGLIPWIDRNPEVTVGFAQRVQDTAEYSRAGLLFGARYGVFEINRAGRVTLKPDGLTKKTTSIKAPYIANAIRLADRFGTWVGKAGNPETILVALGVNR